MIMAGQITKAMEKYFELCDKQLKRDRERNRELWERILSKKQTGGTVRFVRRGINGTKKEVF